MIDISHLKWAVGQLVEDHNGRRLEIVGYDSVTDTFKVREPGRESSESQSPKNLKLIESELEVSKKSIPVAVASTDAAESEDYLNWDKDDEVIVNNPSDADHGKRGRIDVFYPNSASFSVVFSDGSPSRTLKYTYLSLYVAKESAEASVVENTEAKESEEGMTEETETEEVVKTAKPRGIKFSGKFGGKKEKAKKAAEAGAEATPVAEKRRPGRPKKAAEAEAVPAAEKRRPGRPKKAAEAETAPVAEKRRPGRPKKAVTEVAPVAVKRGPGRPKKAVTEVTPVAEKRGPGRPKKAATEATPVAAKRGPGRPKKNQESLTTLLRNPGSSTVNSASWVETSGTVDFNNLVSSKIPGVTARPGVLASIGEFLINLDKSVRSEG